MPARADVTIVPAGHRVTTIAPSPFPGVLTSVGAARVAHFGVESDDQVGDVERVFGRLGHELRVPARPVLLSSAHGALSDLFAPNDPAVVQVGSLLVWIGGHGCFSGFVETAAGVQRLLALFASIATLPNAPTQLLYLTDPTWPNARALLAPMRDLGLEIRTPHPSGTVMMEVHRPEGTVLTALLGEKLAIDPGASTLQSNGGDHAAPTRKPLLRSSRLRALVLEAIQRDDASIMPTLAGALLSSAHPLLLICDAQGRTAPMPWEDGRSALPVFVDTMSLQATVRTLGPDASGVGMAQFDIIKLCRYALENGKMLALNVYAPSPRYLLLTDATVRALAAGHAPEPDDLARERLRRAVADS